MMRESSTKIRKEVQAFIIATEHLYKSLARGKSLNVHEAEAVDCCMDELLAKGSGDQLTGRASRSFGERLRLSWERNKTGE